MSAHRHGRAGQLAALLLLIAGAFTATCGSDQTLRPDPGALTEAARPQPTINSTSNVTPEKLQLASSAFADNGTIPQKYTCDGEEKSPPLTITGVPARAESLALAVTDVDGPGGDFVHWTVWNIDSSVRAIPEGTVPQGGVEGQTTLGRSGYAAPCPSTGVHHYVFDLYALDQLLQMGTAAGKSALLKEMEGHILDQAELTGTYGRSPLPISTVP